MTKKIKAFMGNLINKIETTVYIGTGLAILYIDKMKPGFADEFYEMANIIRSKK